MKEFLSKNRFILIIFVVTGAIVLRTFWTRDLESQEGDEQTTPARNPVEPPLAGVPAESAKPAKSANPANPANPANLERNGPSPMPAEGLSSDQANPKDLRRYSSRNVRETTPRMVQYAKSFVRISKNCKAGVKAACDRLEADDGKVRVELASIQKKLEKACEASDIRSCLGLGDIKQVEGHEEESKKSFEKAKAIVETTQVRCLRGEEPSAIKCRRASKVIKAIEARVSRIQGL